MLKVLVTGAYSTGKTTLIVELATQLRAAGVEVVVTPDVARNCPVPLNADQTVDSTIWLIATQVSRELGAQHESAQVVLCDRGIPDVLAHHVDQAEKGGDPSGWITSLDLFLERWITTYDVIFYSRIDHDMPIRNDGIRSADEEYRTRLETSALRYLDGRPRVEMLPFGGSERTVYTIDVIRQHLARAEAGAGKDMT